MKCMLKLVKLRLNFSLLVLIYVSIFPMGVELRSENVSKFINKSVGK